jgi:hypothetical protein
MNKSFEDQWNDALRDASQTPPPDIWNKVEAELDKKQRKGFILWKNPRLLSGAAAAVLLVLSTLYFSNQSTPVAGLPGILPKQQEAEQGLAYEAPSASTTEAFEEEGSLNRTATSTGFQKVLAANSRETTGQVNSSAFLSGAAETSPAPASIPMEKMPSLAYAATGSALPLPGVTTVNTTKENETVKKKNWIAIAAQNSGFQPNFSAPGLQQAALSAAVNSSNLIPFDKAGPAGAPGGEFQFTNTNRSDITESLTRGQSFSFGLGMGNKFKNKWGWETGLKYTHATAYNTSNVYVFDKATGKTDSYFHANYVNQAKPSDEFMVSVNSQSKYSYHFLAIPVLLNYDVLQVGQFKVQAVAGVSGEWFMGGKIETDNGSEKINAGNSKYKALSLAGIGGLRLSYPITQALDLQLGGQYQHFLTSGLESTGNATLRPSMMGIQLGLSVRR